MLENSESKVDIGTFILDEYPKNSKTFDVIKVLATEENLLNIDFMRKCNIPSKINKFIGLNFLIHQRHSGNIILENYRDFRQYSLLA